MSRTTINTKQIRDQEVTRPDINTMEHGKALITKIIPGLDLILENSTGVDEGTGDVTIGVADRLQIGSGCRAYQNSAQSLLGDIQNKINFDVESYDVLAEYDPVESKFTALGSGFYLVFAHVNITHFRCSRLYIRKNAQDYITAIDSDAWFRFIGGNMVVKLSAGDYIQIYLYVHNDVQTIAGENKTFITVNRL